MTKIILSECGYTRLNLGGFRVTLVALTTDN
ncbi:hypothetical protein TFLX_04167 [Thermoflexales bacterium]|nr:hypothetical protein TFLX_04167 [Thermoflexales bacterium]